MIMKHRRVRNANEDSIKIKVVRCRANNVKIRRLQDQFIQRILQIVLVRCTVYNMQIINGMHYNIPHFLNFCLSKRLVGRVTGR